MSRSPIVITLLIALILTLAACSSQASAPAASVETYLRGLIEKDADAVINSSCLAWEAQALAEVDSFSTVDAELKDFSCTQSGETTDGTLVSCSGTIIFSYGDERQELSVEGQDYIAVQENGEWRMCGYR
ncbi:MAG: hypothetical protein OEZ02_09115 [Anaerolineae bacterium]|nr:hypothetical protein [Anaerolineae bacterium]